MLRRRMSPVNRIMPLHVLGLIRGRRGEPGAWPALDEALDLAVQAREVQCIVLIQVARAELNWLAGERGGGPGGTAPGARPRARSSVTS